MKEETKERILRIILLPLVIITMGLAMIVACVIFLFFLPFVIYQELSDREGHRRRKELWSRLKKTRSQNNEGS